MKIIAAFIALTAIIAGTLYLNHSRASIVSVTIAPTSAGTDDVVGTTDANYDISYDTDSTSSVSTITVTFPSDYTMDTVFGGSGYMQSCNGTLNDVCINGSDRPVGAYSVTGHTITINLGASFDYSLQAGNDTVSFRIIKGIANPTTSGAKSASGFIVDDNAAGNDPMSPSSDVTIIPGPAVTLDFTTEPSYTPTPSHGDVPSNVVWTVQPVITAHDSFGNVATSYDGDIVSVSLGSGIGVLNFATQPPSICGLIANDSYYVAAVAGVADFSAAELSYVAGMDHEPFTLLASHSCGSDGAGISTFGTSSTLTADVVADTLQWSADMADCISTSACATQGTVQAVQLVAAAKGAPTPYQDVDYTGDVTIGTDGPGSLVGTALQGAMTAGELATSGIGYLLQDPATPETIHFTADSGSLTQAFGADALVAVAPVTPSPTPTPTAAVVLSPTPTPSPISGGHTSNPAELPGYSDGTTGSSTENASCSPYLKTYMRLGARNGEVSKLQTFLAKLGFFSAAPTGFFGKVTENAVKLFQEKYTQDVLKYWGLNKGTGYVYITTQKKINELSCTSN